MNVELLRDIQRRFTEYPESCDMSVYGSRSGSCGCIAHAATVLRGVECRYTEVPFRAEELLDINYSVVDMFKLFVSGEWPEDLRIELKMNHAGTKEYADVVCRRIDRFIATGE